MKVFAISSIVFIFLLLPASCAFGFGQNPKACIVCVGLDYRGTVVNQLNGTADDAREVARCLKDLYTRRGIETEVNVLTSCTAGDVTDLLQSLELKEEDFLVFYWSGHGHIDSSGMFLVAYPEEEERYSRLYMSDITAFTEKLPCPSAVLLDCCYAGCGVSDFSISVLGEQPLKRSAVIASCAEDELSLITHIRTVEGTIQAHSVFTVALLEELGWSHSISSSEGGYIASDPGRLSASDLGIRIRKKLGERSQNPVFDRTDVPVFIVP